MIAGFMSTFY